MAQVATGRTRRVTFSGKFSVVGQATIQFDFFTGGFAGNNASLVITGSQIDGGYQAKASFGNVSQIFNWTQANGASTVLLPKQPTTFGSVYYDGYEWTELIGTFEGYLDLYEVSNDGYPSELPLIGGSYHIGISWNPGTVSFDGIIGNTFNGFGNYGADIVASIQNARATWYKFQYEDYAIFPIQIGPHGAEVSGSATFMNVPVEDVSFDSGLNTFKRNYYYNGTSSIYNSVYESWEIINTPKISINSFSGFTSPGGSTLANSPIIKQNLFLTQEISVHSKVYQLNSPHPDNFTTNVYANTVGVNSYGLVHSETNVSGEVNYTSPATYARSTLWANSVIHNQIGKGGKIGLALSDPITHQSIAPFYASGPSYSLVTVSQDGDVDLPPPGNYSPAINCRGYRFIVMDTTDPISVTIKHLHSNNITATKIFNNLIPKNGKVYIDLCGGDNYTQTIDTQSAYNPLQDSGMWGFDAITSIQITSGSILNAKLIRRKSAVLHVAPNNPFTGIYNGLRAAIEVDGKRATEPIPSSGSSGFDFSALGWNVTNTPNTNWYAALKNTSGVMFGGSVILDIFGFPTYYNQTDVSGVFTVPYQLRFFLGIDSGGNNFTAYPGMGDYLYGGDYGNTTHLETIIIIGATTTGIAIDAQDNPVQGATVTCVDYNNVTHTTVTDELGIYSFDNLPGQSTSNKAYTFSIQGGSGSLAFPITNPFNFSTIPLDNIQRIAWRAKAIILSTKGIHATRGSFALFHYVNVVPATGIVFTRYSRQGGVNDTITAYNSNSVGYAQIARQSDNSLGIVFEENETIKIINSSSLGSTWSDPMSITQGILPAYATDEKYGLEYVAVYDRASGDWNLWTKHLEDSDFTLVGLIVNSSTQANAGLEVGSDNQNTLLFIYIDGSGNVSKVQSNSQGENWEAV